ncbi:hypothetical protein GF312_21650 [Candidatus Poribacteria bacterium]|nr:hypothetical protein [Candidatus Poribacteria bacterium]
MKSREKRLGGVTIRAVLIGLLFVPINVYLVVQWETVWGTQYPTTMSIFFNAIFCLFLVTVLNLIARKYIPKSALTQAELLTTYVVLITAVTVSGHDFTQGLFCSVGTVKWFATTENEWMSIFGKHLPEWLTVTDEKVLQDFFEGESTFYDKKHIMGWLEPMLWWTFFLTTLAVTTIFINVLIRKQWIEREKLTYPLVQLPYEMTRENSATSFFKNRLLWIGFGIAAGIDILNGLNYLYRVFPAIPLRYNLGTQFVEKPWNAMGSFWVQVNPYAIGLAFAIPLDLQFSCWFLFLFWKFQRIMGSAIGLNLPGYPFEDQQILGAYLGIAAVAIWMGRKPLWQILKRIIGLASEVDDSDEPMKYRTAFVGTILGIVLLVAFSYRAGMSIVFAIAFFLIYFTIIFSFTRMRAELGPPLQGIHYSGPLQLMVALLGSRGISSQTFTAAAPYWPLTKEIRNTPTPFQLESFKLAERSGINTKKLWKVIAVITCLSVFLTFWAFLQLNYKWGGVGAWRGVSAYTTMERWITNPVETNYNFLIATGVGFIFVVINTFLRLRFLWWTLHPLGYPLAGYYHFEKLWFPFFISWATKMIILKYGGIKLYRKAFPFFLGLVLGEFVIGSLWGIIGLLTSRPTYAFKSW